MTVYLWFSYILTAAYVLLMVAYSYGYFKPKPHAHAPKAKEQPFFSIIIPARNEAANIEQCLSSILNNHYPGDRFEIILIDDFSEDTTYAIASKLSGNLQVIRLSDYINKEERLNAFKKKALEIGISKAKGTYIITTDADCIIPPNWLQAYADKLNASGNLQCLAGPVNFIPCNNKKNWLYYFQSIDFMTMQGITIASNRLGLGNMSNGANFLFSKEAFETVGGYKGIDQKASGDDMMLMQKIQQQYPDGIDFLFNKNAIVATPVQPDWSAFLNQRIRWASKADSYPQVKLTLVLLLVYLFNLNFLLLGISACCNAIALKSLLYIFLSKLIAELAFVMPLSIFFNKRNELFYLIILQPLHILYIIAAGFLGKFGTYNWKGRSVH
ncbi:MAG: glycosyltransferase [Sphingobacteriales bacterium]|nr:MAG: glycosyltransferase [Sphingobacteriales bacterium]